MLISTLPSARQQGDAGDRALAFAGGEEARAFLHLRGSAGGGLGLGVVAGQGRLRGGLSPLPRPRGGPSPRRSAWPRARPRSAPGRHPESRPSSRPSAPRRRAPPRQRLLRHGLLRLLGRNLSLGLLGGRFLGYGLLSGSLLRGLDPVSSEASESAADSSAASAAGASDVSSAGDAAVGSSPAACEDRSPLPRQDPRLPRPNPRPSPFSTESGSCEVSLFCSSVIYLSVSIGFGMLRRVRVVRAGVDLQLGQLLAGEPVARQHALDGLADDLLRSPLEHLRQACAT